MGDHALLRGIFLTQGSNPSLLLLLHWQGVLCHQCHLGSPGGTSGKGGIGWNPSYDDRRRRRIPGEVLWGRLQSWGDQGV